MSYFDPFSPEPVTLRWSLPRPVRGPAPVGEIEKRCPGCGLRFLSGEEYLSRLLPSGWPIGIFSHPGPCAEKLELMGA